MAWLIIKPETDEQREGRKPEGKDWEAKTREDLNPEGKSAGEQGQSRLEYCLRQALHLAGLTGDDTTLGEQLVLCRNAKELSQSLEELSQNRKEETELLTFEGGSGLPRQSAAQNRMKLLFAVELDEVGMNPEAYHILGWIRRNPGCLSGCLCGMVFDGKTEWYTKSMAQELSLAISMAGGLQVGRPLAEGTGSLLNQKVTSRNLGVSLEEAYVDGIRGLLERMRDFHLPQKKEPKLLCLHASDYETSNTLQLWKMIRAGLPESVQVKEISLRNGEVFDCGGCPFPMCMHFSRKSSCYYGGTIVESVYPAVEECDAILLLCPNYNDAVSANLAAFFNRLTSLFRRRQFYEKQLFAVVVSGYSGGDIVARQVLGALSMNKTFILPPQFVLSETANDPGSIRQAAGIEERAAQFAAHIWEQIGVDE